MGVRGDILSMYCRTEELYFKVPDFGIQSDKFDNIFIPVKHTELTKNLIDFSRFKY